MSASLSACTLAIPSFVMEARKEDGTCGTNSDNNVMKLKLKLLHPSNESLSGRGVKDTTA